MSGAKPLFPKRLHGVDSDFTFIKLVPSKTQNIKCVCTRESTLHAAVHRPLPVLISWTWLPHPATLAITALRSSGLCPFIRMSGVAH